MPAKGHKNRVAAEVSVIAVALALMGLAIGHAARAQSPTVAVYVRTVRELRTALEGIADEQPLAVAVGRYKAAPVRLDYRTLSVDAGRSGWWDKHLGGAEQHLVLVLTESTREEANSR